MRDGTVNTSLFHSKGLPTPSAIWLDKRRNHRFGHEAIEMARTNPDSFVRDVRKVLGLKYCDELAKMYAERRKPNGW